MPRVRPSSLLPSLYLAAPSQAARFNCAFINATLIYGYRVAKGFFFFSDFFCKYLYIFSLSFSSTSLFFCFSCSYSNCCLARCLYCFSTQFVGRAPRAFCLILFGSQLPQQQTQQQHQQQQHATDQMRLQNCSLLLLLWLPKLLTLQRSQIADRMNNWYF